jgi:rsbT co-antagonist protein RsbR
MENQLNKNVLSIWVENRGSIIKDWMHQDGGQTGSSFLPREANSKSVMYEEIFDCIVDDLRMSDNSSQNVTSERFTDLADILSVNWISNGYAPRDLAELINKLRAAMMEELARRIHDAPQLNQQSVKLDKLMDQFLLICFQSIITAKEAAIKRQVAEINELSTPIIKVWDGILCLPVIGTLDSARIEDALSDLLRTIKKTEFYIVIVDVAGVPFIDTMVAGHLLKTVQAVRLMGGDCIISGIRPQIAQSIANLGIDLTSVTTKSSMEAALRRGFDLLDLQVSKKSRPATMNVNRR